MGEADKVFAWVLVKTPRPLEFIREKIWAKLTKRPINLVPCTC